MDFALQTFRRSRLAFAASGVLVLCAAPAAATYSIVGADSATREVGGTGTSCLRGSDVYIIYGAAPGFGVIHAQARANQNGRNRGVELLEQGTAPEDVIAQITAASFDSNADDRQYGVVDVAGRAVGFTGQGTQPFADDRQGTVGTFSYSAQGNILTSAAVLSQAAAAFEASGCDLAERLMRALEAGAENGEGDNRCTPDGIPSDSSFIQVERPGTDEGSYLELHVRNSGSDSPIPGLREQFDDWRATHPCPVGTGGSGGGGAGSTGGSAGTSGASGSAGASGAGGRASGGTSGGSPSGGTSAGSPSGGTSAGSPSGGTSAGSPSSGGSAGSASAGASSAAGVGYETPASQDPSGCSCRTGTRPGAAIAVPLAAALAALVFCRRRRR